MKFRDLKIVIVACRVAKHQDMFAVLVFEVVEDPVLFKQSRNEIEIRFAILNAVFARGILVGKIEFEVFNTSIAGLFRRYQRFPIREKCGNYCAELETT